ncbi:60S ribosomal protein L24 [Podila clonocystis]|nr:60S ribosomal protein L24 [Podila clonocystis]
MNVAVARSPSDGAMDHQSRHLYYALSLKCCCWYPKEKQQHHHTGTHHYFSLTNGEPLIQEATLEHGCRTAPTSIWREIEICAFSGAKIYPGKGKIYVRVDNRSFRFVNGKAESLFLQRKNPRKISWTVLFRRMHKKGISEEVAKKRNRRTVKHQRAVVGASWEAIRAKRNQKPEVRAAARAAALRDGKDKKKQEDAKKKSEKAKSASSAARGQPKVSKQQAKGAKVSIANTSR